ncbi:heterokaryon incompatibility protein-domain-containing protein [Neurospora tetraspora]|uniref:Heterokaryon incompatibility protein-domain-containing protein n=1 Tax=Neurospora tetraspora TaxID=94610 RepID=A0AAE0JE50_9PEZI|nr:heterokaryon incompatibility protein-domain-containing protein [Neurospora tetraspora]
MHYAALSYCWGGNQALLLTSDTIEELSFKGISQEDLPRTIADAITVAISLGIQYLWVDALCILQDSEEDKAREIAKVAMVYSNATVTMAVSRASSVDEGFLSDRFPVEHTAVIELIVSEYQPGSTKTAMLVPQEPDATDLVSVMDHNPLGKRAWTFQERLLSPRVLDYGEVQTRWWCPEMMKLKDAPERTVWTDGWVYPEAGDTGHSSGYRYVAGLWAEMMPSALLWITKSSATQRRASCGKYWGPTWSWASVDGAVQLLEDSSPDTWWTEVARKFQCDVVGWEVEPLHKPSGGDEFGALKSAVLILSGHPRPAYWRRSKQCSGENMHAHLDPCFCITGRTGAEESLLSRVRFDTWISGFGGVEHTSMAEQQQSARDLDLFFLVIASMCEKNKLGYTLPSSVPGEKRWQEGLVLRKLVSGEYCRIGTFQSEAEAIFFGPGPGTDSIHRVQQQWMVEGPRQIIRLV